MVESKFVYGKSLKVTLDVLITNEENRVCEQAKNYGENYSAILDAFVHLRDMQREVQEFYTLAVEGSPIDQPLIDRIKDTDEEAYKIIIALSASQKILQAELDGIRADACMMADALADINNDIGETKLVKALVGPIDSIISDYKGRVE